MQKAEQTELDKTADTFWHILASACSSQAVPNGKTIGTEVTNITELKLICGFKSISVCFMKLGKPILCAFIFRILVVFMDFLSSEFQNWGSY